MSNSAQPNGGATVPTRSSHCCINQPSSTHETPATWNHRAANRSMCITSGRSMLCHQPASLHAARMPQLSSRPIAQWITPMATSSQPPRRYAHMKTSGSMVLDDETYHTKWYVSTSSTVQADAWDGPGG